MSLELFCIEIFESSSCSSTDNFNFIFLEILKFQKGSKVMINSQNVTNFKRWFYQGPRFSHLLHGTEEAIKKIKWKAILHDDGPSLPIPFDRRGPNLKHFGIKNIRL